MRGDSRTGVGVAGKSRSVAGVEGQSEFDVGGVFVNIRENGAGGNLTYNAWQWGVSAVQPG